MAVLLWDPAQSWVDTDACSFRHFSRSFGCLRDVFPNAKLFIILATWTIYRKTSWSYPVLHVRVKRSPRLNTSQLLTHDETQSAVMGLVGGFLDDVIYVQDSGRHFGVFAQDVLRFTSVATCRTQWYRFVMIIGLDKNREISLLLLLFFCRKLLLLSLLLLLLRYSLHIHYICHCTLVGQPIIPVGRTANKWFSLCFSRYYFSLYLQYYFNLSLFAKPKRIQQTACYFCQTAAQ